MSSISYYQSTRNRGLINFIILLVVLGLAFYFGEFDEKLSRFKSAELLPQSFVLLVVSLCSLFFSILIIVSIKDIIVNGKFGVQFYENNLEYLEANKWMNKSYKLEYKDIIEIRKEYYSDGNDFFICSNNGKKYQLANLDEDSIEDALKHLESVCEHIKVVVVNKPNT